MPLSALTPADTAGLREGAVPIHVAGSNRASQQRVAREALIRAGLRYRWAKGSRVSRERPVTKRFAVAGRSVVETSFFV